LILIVTGVAPELPTVLTLTAIALNRSGSGFDDDWAAAGPADARRATAATAIAY
jgi:hypothetical protein